ncbi:hypothetical protein [Streptomyces zagrosensis]|uniref:Uncharacterized protein n=1 Tax=Streptomyces zagrosensis TaxID=1042984 RepID=A0A7W9QGX6_9ACTN|nr:hypothetical protein [Streptomyces zagrosensis]MBB5940075.1 hypothetical protein [Streptomyces zagrosensis]
MQSGNDDLARTLAGGDRTPSHTTRLGGMTIGDEFFTEATVGSRLQSWTLERSYNTDLPNAMRAFAGSASAQLELEISGTDALSAPQLYSPWANRWPGDALRPGQTVVHTAGVNGIDLPAFRGTLRSRSALSGSDTVKVSALDGAERLRGPAALNNPYSGSVGNQQIASATWCVDELLRQGGVHSCPPPRAPNADEIDKITGRGDYDPFTIFYASLHGGLNSTYGHPHLVPATDQYTYVREGAPHAMALVPKERGLTASWMPRSRVIVPSDDRLLVEAHVNSGLGPGDTVDLTLVLDEMGEGSSFITLYVDFAAGVVFIGSGDSDDNRWFAWKWPLLAALKGAWHIGMLIDVSGTGYQILPKVKPFLVAPDGTRLAGAVAEYTDLVASLWNSELLQLDLKTSVAVEALQVTTRVSPGMTKEDFDRTGTWVKSVELDDPVLPLYAIPKVSGSQWDAISSIAKASMSTAEFDERGVFRWRNANRFQTQPTTPDLTVSSRREIAALTVSEEIDACRNYCEQPYQDWAGRGFDFSEEAKDTAVRRIDPGRSLEVGYTVAEDEFDVGPPVIYDFGDIPGGSRVRFGDGYVEGVSGGASVKGTVVVTARREGGMYILRFTNQGKKTVWTTTKDGKPSVVIAPVRPKGEPVQRHKASWNADSRRYYGLQQYDAEASEWVQSATVAQALADTMLAAGRNPVPVLSDVEVLYDPRIQLGDVVRVIDQAGASFEALAWVIGIRTSCAAGGSVQQTLTLRGTEHNGSPMGYWLDTDPPTDPEYWRLRTYAEVAAAHTTLAALATITYATLKDHS